MIVNHCSFWVRRISRCSLDWHSFKRETYITKQKSFNLTQIIMHTHSALVKKNVWGYSLLQTTNWHMMAEMMLAPKHVCSQKHQMLIIKDMCVCVCVPMPTQGNPMPHKADRWRWVWSIFNSCIAWADHIPCGMSICIVYWRKLK